MVEGQLAARISRATFIAALSLWCASASAQFPDAHDPPPAGWTGPVFRLKQDYPQTLPSVGSRPWMSFDFRTQPNEYIKAVLDYALDGNKQVDFVVQNNNTRGWYHAPWMHAGAAGREFVRGLTREEARAPASCTRTRRARSRTGRSASTTRAAATPSARSGRTPTRRTRAPRSFRSAASA